MSLSILITFLPDDVWILQEEVTCQSVLVVKEFKVKGTGQLRTSLENLLWCATGWIMCFLKAIENIFVTFLMFLRPLLGLICLLCPCNSG